jgi:transcriptional regulator of arginine metabolism
MPSTTNDPSSRRHQRHRAILEIVGSVAVRSQNELAEHLAERDLAVNQATLSRDLRELGLVKGPRGYALPSQLPALDPLTQACEQWLRSAEAVAHQVVLRTPPGGAAPLAIALDDASMDGLVGTLAGDDTILTICRTPRAAQRLVAHLLSLVPGGDRAAGGTP